MRTPVAVLAAWLSLVAATSLSAGQEVRPPTPIFGGSYTDLSPEQQRLVEDWVQRFRSLTGQEIDTAPFYEDFIRLSTKTTFQAVTHALQSI